ncbi:hypothetical protein [Halopenitus salinus]|uniref:PrsW family intramembrane metalloprotease n=1 Tax=Halopenitus salinus TaxID=1198295 RepID=A0ABD5UWG5_9EURY
MGWGNKSLRWLGTLGGIVALISLGITAAIVVGLYVVSFESLNVPIGLAELLVPALVAVVGFVIWALSRITLRFTDDSGSGSEPAGVDDPEVSGDSTAAGSGESIPESRARLREFNRANKYVAAIFGLLFALAVASSALVEAASGTPFGIVVGFVTFLTEATGGTTNHLLTAAWFGGAWYGIRKYEATEAWVAGLVGWGLLTMGGVYLLTVSLGAIAIVVAGLKVLNGGLRASGETELVFLDEYVDELDEGGTLTANDANDADGSSDVGDAGTSAASSDAGNATGTGNATDAGNVVGRSRSRSDDGKQSIAGIRDQLEGAEIRGPSDVRDVLEVDPEFVHPREAGNDRIAYWSYLSYALGGLLVLSSLLVGIQLWGFPALGLWGIPIGAVYLGHAFGLPQRSPVVHVAGAVWYVFGLLVSVVTFSPLAILANAAGVYLGWTSTAGVPQPDEVLTDVQGGSTADGRSDASFPEDLIGGGIVAGAILGAVLGVVGAVLFAWISVRTRTVYGLLLILPAVAAGFGVTLGMGERGDVVSGLVGAGLAVLSIVVGFRLLNRWMPPGYELQPGLLLAVVPLLGIYLAYRIAASSESEGGTREDADGATDGADGDPPESAGRSTVSGTPRDRPDSSE